MWLSDEIIIVIMCKYCQTFPFMLKLVCYCLYFILIITQAWGKMSMWMQFVVLENKIIDTPRYIEMYSFS